MQAEITSLASVLILVSSLLVLSLFYFANGKPKASLIFLIAWSLLHAILAYSGFYSNVDARPPRFAFILLPNAIIMIFSLRKQVRQKIRKSVNPVLSSLLHIVRIPVELCLMQLFLLDLVPELMTFQGRNFDILLGITAPILALLLWKKMIGNKALLIWNIWGLIMVTFILINGVLSAEMPIQQFAFDQPNKGLAYFPFILLPAVVAPLVMWTHIAEIIRLKGILKS